MNRKYKCDYCGDKIHYPGQHTSFRFCAAYLKVENERLRDLILQFAASFSLADHIGDVHGDVGFLLDKIGFTENWYDQHDLHDLLAKEDVTTLYGTSLYLESVDE